MTDAYAIDHVQLAMPAGREVDARRFYDGVLHFEEPAKPAKLAARGGVRFRSGAVYVHLGVNPAFIPAKKAHPAFRCADYAELLQRFTAHGIEVTDDPLTFDGEPRCYVADPFGNRLEFIRDSAAATSCTSAGR